MYMLSSQFSVRGPGVSPLEHGTLFYSSVPHAPSTPAGAGTSGTWPHAHSSNTSHCILRSPFFPARHAGLPDLVDQLQSHVAELEVDGSEFLRLRHIHGVFYQLANRRFDLRSEFLHKGFDAFFS